MRIAEFMEILKHSDTVTLSLKGVGETRLSAQEVHECLAVQLLQAVDCMCPDLVYGVTLSEVAEMLRDELGVME